MDRHDLTDTSPLLGDEPDLSAADQARTGLRADDSDDALRDDIEEMWPSDPEVRSAPGVCALVHGTYHALMNVLAVSTRTVGLTPSDAIVLRQLFREPRIAPARLRRTTGLHRSTLASILNRLEARGLVSRPPVPGVARRLEIDLTPAGRLHAELAAAAMDEVELQLSAFISMRSRRAARDLFESCLAIYRPDVELDI